MYLIIKNRTCKKNSEKSFIIKNTVRRLRDKFFYIFTQVFVFVGRNRNLFIPHPKKRTKIENQLLYSRDWKILSNQFETC